MIRAARLVAVTSVVAVALATLTACTPNVVNGAQLWLNGQDGVSSASIVVDRTTMYGSSGVVRGELDQGVDGARLDLLVERVAGYVKDNPNTEMRLGVADVDFVVDGSSTDAARETWGELRGLDGIVAALASGGGVRVHVLRPALVDTLESLENLPAAVEVEAFRTDEDEQQDRRDDDYGPAQRTYGSFQFRHGGGCDPSIEQWSRYLDTAAVDAIAGGAVDACGEYDLTYDEDSDLSAVATAWAESQALAADPVPTLVVQEDGAGYHEISVTPGDSTLFPVVAAFEEPGAPVVQYWLGVEGTLDLRGWEDPPGEILEILASSPLAERLTSISLEGDIEGPVGGESVTAAGTLAELGTLVADAEALIALDPSFYQVAIEPSAVSIDLYSPPGSDPDMASAATALRSSPIWTTRDTYVNYMQGYVLIHEGVAELGSDTYSRPEPLEAFAAAWNAGATP